MAQADQYVEDKSLFQHLIGLKYTKTADLVEYSPKGRTITAKKDTITSSVHLTIDNYNIYTSEFIKYDEVHGGKVHRIVDIVVLNQELSSCEGCYFSNIKGVTIKTLHEKSDKNQSNIIVAFERNRMSGLYTQIDTIGLQRNPKFDMLLKN